MTRHLLLPFVVLSTLLIAVFAQSPVYAQADNCSYDDAALFDGWGWDAVAMQSCPPRETPSNGGCDYSSAALYNGWGWNPDTRQSCPPLDAPVEQQPSEQPAEQPQSDGLCDYQHAAQNGGWGWNATDRTPCPPQHDDAAPQTSSDNTDHPVCSSALLDPDGDGFGWENDASCVVAATNSPPPTTDRPICQQPNSDPDGDGFGWEDNTTCVVVEDSTLVAMSPSGAIDSGTPAYTWPASDDAQLYRIVVSDSAGNGFSHEIDPLSAGCQGGGVCRAQPDLAYYDNALTWKVETIVDGRTTATSASVGFTTPISLDVQPVTSNPDACEAYPSVVYGNFIAINNIWNARSMRRDGWSQTIRVDQALNSAATASWRYDWLAESDGGIYDVKSYPEVIYGNKLGVHISGSKAQTGLPAKVSELEEFTVEFSYSDLGNAERNVALESFFHETCDITGPCDTYDNRAFEMMIWVKNPSVRTPGDLTLTGVMIDNHLWDVYTKPRSNKKYIAFTAQSPITTGTLHWNRFVEWTANWTRENSVSRNIDVLQPDHCMGAIEIGTEVWNGSGTFTLDSYRISRQ